MYQDKTLVCRDCGSDFTFSAGEQEFYASKGFENEPTRCPQCRSARKNGRNSSRGHSQSRKQMYSTICADCGAETEVPFEPTAGRPVYCKDCFATHKRPY